MNTAVKPARVARSEEDAAPKAAPQTLREAQSKKFKPSSLQGLGHDFDILAVKVPEDWTFEDVLQPSAWSSVANLVSKDALNTRRDKVGSLIYARHDGGAFKALLVIEAITHDVFGQPNGLVVKPWLT